MITYRLRSISKISEVVATAAVICLLSTMSISGVAFAQGAPTVLFEDDFESGDFNKWNEGHAQIDSIVTRAVAGCPQGNLCLKRVFPHSPPTASEYDAMGVTTAHFSKAYLSYWAKISPNFTFGGGAGDHYWRFWSNILGDELDVGWYPTFQNFNFMLGNTSTQCTGEYDHIFDVPTSYYKLGQWQFVEVYMKLNTTPGSNKRSNGVFKVWIDHQLVTNVTNGCMRDNLNLDFNRFVITNYNFESNEGPVTWWFDDFKLLTDLPNNPPDTNAPADITDLQVH